MQHAAQTFKEIAASLFEQVLLLLFLKLLLQAADRMPCNKDWLSHRGLLCAHQAAHLHILLAQVLLGALARLPTYTTIQVSVLYRAQQQQSISQAVKCTPEL